MKTIKPGANSCSGGIWESSDTPEAVHALPRLLTSYNRHSQDCNTAGRALFCILYTVKSWSPEMYLSRKVGCRTLQALDIVDLPKEPAKDFISRELEVKYARHKRQRPTYPSGSSPRESARRCPSRPKPASDRTCRSPASSARDTQRDLAAGRPQARRRCLQLNDRTHIDRDG